MRTYLYVVFLPWAAPLRENVLQRLKLAETNAKMPSDIFYGKVEKVPFDFFLKQMLTSQILELDRSMCERGVF